MPGLLVLLLSRGEAYDVGLMVLFVPGIVTSLARELAAETEASDIRASVEISYEPGGWRAETRFVSAAAGLRMLRVRWRSPSRASAR